MEGLNINLLPEEAKRELYDFYEYLLKKYGVRNNKRKKDDVDYFFDKYNLDFSGFKFNREEIYGR
jgi:hypothetical protein